MACAATKKQDTISEDFDDDSFLWRYTFTFSDPSAASKFLEIATDGKSIQDTANAAGVEIECDADEKVVKAKSYGDRKATVITISEKLPCVEDWYKIAKSCDGKADVICRALTQETGEKYFNYRYLGDGNKGQPVIIQGSVKESKEMEEANMEESRKPKDKISDFVGIDKLELETDYVDGEGTVFDIYKYEDIDNDLYGISVRDDDGEVIDGENGFILKNGMSMLDLTKEMMNTVGVKIQDSYFKKRKRNRSKRVYAEIQSTDSPSHITWFKDLKTARRELENHIASMTKVGDYEIFRDEKAADVKMQEGDFEITLYVPSGSEDIVDNDVEHVIIRQKKEQTVKEEINKMNKQLKTDVTPVMNKIKVIGKPESKFDFLFYCGEIIGEGGNPIVFWVHEGTGDNLDDEQEEQGFNDYIYYTIYEGVKYSTIDKFIYGDYDVLEQFEGDSDFVYLYNNYRDLTVQQICWKILKNYGEDVPEKLTVRILEGNTAVDDFKRDAQKYTTKKSAQNESLINDENHNIELSAYKAARFIKESVEWLIQEKMGCCTKELTPEVQLAVGWLNGNDPEDTTLIHSKEDPTWCICVGIVAADGDDLKTDLEWLTIPYVADGENEGDVFSELMTSLSPKDNYAKVFEYLAKEYEGILKEYDVHSDGKCFHKKGKAATEESIKPKKGKGGLTFKEKCRAAQRGFKYAPDLDYLMYEDEDMVIASDEAHIPSWDVLNSGDYDLYGREVTEDDTYLGDGDIPTLMDSMLYDGPWEKFTIRNGHLVGREPTDEQPA